MPTLANHSLKWQQQVLWGLKHIMPVFGSRDIATIHRAEVQEFLSGKLGSLSHASVGHLRKILFAIFKLAEYDGRVQKNPVALVKLPAKREAPEAPYSLSEVARLLESAKGLKVYNAILLAVTTGLREGECLGVKKSDIKNRVLEVRRQHEDQPLKTPAAYRNIPIPDLPFDKHTSFICHGMKARRMIGRFSYKDKRGWNFSAQGYCAAVEKAGLRRLPFHSLRKTFATELEVSGCPEGLIRVLLGHASKNVTRLYISSSEEVMRKHVEDVWNRLCAEIERLQVARVGA